MNDVFESNRSTAKQNIKYIFIGFAVYTTKRWSL